MTDQQDELTPEQVAEYTRVLLVILPLLPSAIAACFDMLSKIVTAYRMIETEGDVQKDASNH